MTPIRFSSLLIALSLLTTGCEPRDTESGPVVCTVIADSPKRADDGERMYGQVRFRCESPGAEVLTLKVTLEKRDGASWRAVSSKTFTVKGKQTYASGLKYQSRQIETDCATGSFRNVVDWSRTSKKDTRGDNLVSGSMKDPCKPLLSLT